jgi:hypothetical protein
MDRQLLMDCHALNYDGRMAVCLARYLLVTGPDELVKQGFASLTAEPDAWGMERSYLRLSAKGWAVVKTDLAVQGCQTSGQLATAFNMLLNYTEQFGFMQGLINPYGERKAMVKQLAGARPVGV